MLSIIHKVTLLENRPFQLVSALEVEGAGGHRKAGEVTCFGGARAGSLASHLQPLI